ncbi:MAG: hypothetical protein ACREXY_07270, partial [Gammaproteobacteria bacterium]
AEPVVMRALAGFCATAVGEIPCALVPLEASLFNETPFEASLAPAGVTQARTATRAKGAAMIEAERETCNIASSMAKSMALAKTHWPLIACAN